MVSSPVKLRVAHSYHNVLRRYYSRAAVGSWQPGQPGRLPQRDVNVRLAFGEPDRVCIPAVPRKCRVRRETMRCIL